MKARLRAAIGLVALLSALPLLGAAAPVASPGPVSQPAVSSADIRDIHGPIWIPAWWRPWLVGLAVLGAGGAALVIARRLRRRQPLTAAERALARLDAATPLALAGESRSYAEAASDAVRTYLEESFGLPATHETTDEFFADLTARQLPPLAPHAPLLAHFLGACDLAKFSLYGMPREGMASLNELARQFVVTTAQPLPASLS